MERSESIMTSYLDREAPRELLTRYAQALDLRHWAEFANVFTDDAVAEYSGYGAIEGGGAGIGKVLQDGMTVFDATHHLLGNHTVELTDTDHSRATAYVQAQHVRRGTPGGDFMLVAGIYEVELVRRNDGWRIAHLVFHATWQEGNPAVMEHAHPNPEVEPAWLWLR